MNDGADGGTWALLACPAVDGEHETGETRKGFPRLGQMRRQLMRQEERRNEQPELDVEAGLRAHEQQCRLLWSLAVMFDAVAEGRDGDGKRVRPSASSGSKPSMVRHLAKDV